MNFSIPAKRIHDSDIEKALIDEIKNGFKLEENTEKFRVQQARKEALQEKGKTHPTLGKCVATIPAREYFRLIHTYGKDTVHSKEFLQFFNRKFTDLSPNRA